MGRSDPRNEGKRLEENLFLGIALVRIHASINEKRLIGHIGVGKEPYADYHRKGSVMQPEAMQRGTGDKSM